MNLVFSLGIALRRQTSISGTGQPARPVNTVRPVVTGQMQPGQVLSADTGTWMGSPTGYTRQWRRNGAAILGAVAATYTLQAADVGSRISVAVTAANAAGTTVATSLESGPVTAGTDYFVVALQGQSGVKYAATTERNGPFNVPGALRPAITGNLGHIVEKVGDKPEFPAGVSLANGGLVDMEITNATFQTAAGGQIVPRGAYAVAEFMRFMDPAREPVLLVLSKVGTSMGQMMDNADTERGWINAQSAIDYVEATYGPIDLYVHSWYGSEPMGNDYRSTRAVHWMGEQFDGTKHILGQAADNSAPSGGSRAIDRYLFEVNPGGTYDGLLPYNDGTLKIAFAMHPNQNVSPAVRASVEAVFSDPRLSAMSLGTHLIPMSGHIDDAIEDAPLVTLMTMGPPILKALGRTVRTPAITAFAAAADGTFVDVTVSLPNGGNLTTVRAQQGIPAPASPAATYLPVYGFEVAGPSDAETLRVNLPRAAWSATITSPGTGTAPNRTGTVRLVPATPIANGTKITYRQGGAGTEGSDAIPMDQQAFFNYLIEEVPAWRQAGVEWPFPGIEVAAMDTMTALSVGAGLAPLSSLTTAGATPITPAAPPGLAAGDRVLLIAGASGGTPPALPAGWTDIAIGGDGPAGSGAQVSFRVCTRLWQAGDTMPTFTNANYVDLHRLPGSFRIGTVASDFQNGSGATVPGGPAIAPAVSPLSAGTSHRHMVHVAARSSGQAGFGPTVGLVPGGFVRISNEGGQRTTWAKPDPVATIPAVTMPVAFNSTNGGGVLTIEILRP
jgi:hypothetical protein